MTKSRQRKSTHAHRRPKNSRQEIAPAQAEEGAIVKNWGGKIPVALTMPNSYYVGMVSLALQQTSVFKLTSV